MKPIVLACCLVLVAGCRRSEPKSEEPPREREESGGYVAGADGDAVDQPDGHRVVAHVQKGQRYPLLKRGGPERAWCKLDVGAEAGWVRCAAAPIASAKPALPSSGFAYYVLTLSWSPAFCETPAGAKSPEQCAATPRHGFVVHGLWPQNEKGWPEDCATGGAVSAARVTRMLDIMPSERLVRHEWEKHGTCSGLDADGYFDLVRTAFTSIHVPDMFRSPKPGLTTDLDKVESAFTAANPGLTGDAIAVVCKRDLEEVRICLDKQLKPRPCSADVRDECRGTVRVPPR